MSKLTQSLAKLKQEIKKFENGRVIFRVLCIFSNIILGSKEETSELFGVSVKTLERLSSRYQTEGIEGLEDRPRCGRPSNLSTEEKDEIIKNIEISILAETEEKFTTARDIKDFVEEKFSKSYSSSGIFKIMRKLGLSKARPRPVHEKNDSLIMEHWKERFLAMVGEIENKFKDKKVEIYFQDETRYGQNTILTSIWTVRGQKPYFKKQFGYLNAWIYGAVNPQNGNHYGLVLPRLDGENMHVFLDNFSKSLPHNTHAIVVLDGAGAHRSASIPIPKNISLCFLPPYSPELNPIERLWEFMKRNYLSFKKYADESDIVQKGAAAWKELNQQIVKSICHCSYLPSLGQNLV